MTKKSRQRAEKKGRLAEWLAGLFLQLKGYRIIAKRYRTRNGEIDLVCLKKSTTVLVEVKARPSHEQAVSAVTWTARRRIEAAGQDFLTAHPSLMHYGLRYDIISFSQWRLSHRRDAWRTQE